MVLFTLLTGAIMMLAMNKKNKVSKPSQIPKFLNTLAPASIRELNPDTSKFGLDSQTNNRRTWTPLRQTKNDLATISEPAKKLLLKDPVYVNAYKRNLHGRLIGDIKVTTPMHFFNPDFNYFYGLSPRPISPSYKMINSNGEETRTQPVKAR
jgi:hypothetical protein